MYPVDPDVHIVPVLQVAALRAPCSSGQALVGRVALAAGEKTVTVVTRRNAFQVWLLGACGADTKSWSRGMMS